MGNRAGKKEASPATDRKSSKGMKTVHSRVTVLPGVHAQFSILGSKNFTLSQDVRPKPFTKQLTQF